MEERLSGFRGKTEDAEGRVLGLEAWMADGENKVETRHVETTLPLLSELPRPSSKDKTVRSMIGPRRDASEV